MRVKMSLCAFFVYRTAYKRITMRCAGKKPSMFNFFASQLRVDTGTALSVVPVIPAGPVTVTATGPRPILYASEKTSRHTAFDT